MTIRKTTILFFGLVLAVIVLGHQYSGHDRDADTSPIHEVKFDREVLKKETKRSSLPAERYCEASKNELADDRRVIGEQRQLVKSPWAQKNSFVSADSEHSSKETVAHLEKSRDDLIQQLHQKMRDGHPDGSEVLKIANDLISMGDSNSVSAVLEACRQTEETGFASIEFELLRAIARANNPALTSILDYYARIALTEHHDALVGAISDALANIGTAESVGILKEIMLSSPPETDLPFIVSGALARTRTVEALPQLIDIITERIPGYEGAMKALLNMGGFGVYELAEVIESDNRGDLDEAFYAILNEIEYDQEIYLAFKELTHESVDHRELYLYAMEKYQESRQ